jgi:DNA-binding MarR family transcriptional regulator
MKPIATGRGQGRRRASRASDDPPLRLERFLPYRLALLANLVSEGLSDIYGERFGFGIPEWRLIATLGQFGTMTAKQVGNYTHMHKTKVSRAVAHLARRRFLKRRTNRKDKREEHLTLTPQGRAVYEKIAPLALAFARHLYDDIALGDRKTFERVLDRLTVRMLRGAARNFQPRRHE